LAEAGTGEQDGDEAGEAATAEADSPEVEGDMDDGTGIWAHDSEAPINYNLLLNRFFKLLNTHNPDLMSGGGKSSIRIPPPQCLREGNKKTIFANLSEICKRMKRSDEHVTQYLFTELGTSGSTDGSRRLVIKGKFLQKQIENVLRRYIGMLKSGMLR
jgi:translation initiation factor 2 subunit 2